MMKTNLRDQRNHIYMRIAVAVLLFASTAVGRVWAWGSEGHSIVGRIAELHLTDKTKAGVQDLLGKATSISDDSVASWPDHIRRDRPEASPWHYVDIPFDAASYDANRDCKSGQCVVVQIEHFASVLADTNATTVTKAEALRFLVHFVGDIHQPLHCSERNHDKGGNLVKVAFLSETRETNLHRVWDGQLLREYLKGENVLKYADRLNSKISTEQAKDWDKGSVADWAWESHQAAVNNTYHGVPIQSVPVKLDQDYVAANQIVVEEQLMKGGIRLALLLNRAFDSPKQ